jgi:hypothetical protein
LPGRFGARLSGVVSLLSIGAIDDAIDLPDRFPAESSGHARIALGVRQLVNTID